MKVKDILKEFIINECEDSFTFDISTEFGNIYGEFNYRSNTYKVTELVTKEQYSNIYMIDEDEVTDEDIQSWNLELEFSNDRKALLAISGLIDDLYHETDGSLDANVVSIVVSSNSILA